MAYIGREPQVGNFQVCDDITVVNGQAAYTMQVGGVNVLPETANHCLVSLNGVLQKSSGTSPSFTISGSTITFASNLVTGDVINFIHILGSVLDLGVPSDSTVTNAKTNFVSTSSAAGLQIKGDGTTDGTLQLNCSQNSHGIKLKSPPHSASASYTLTFPNNDGDANQFLQTNGSGVLSFADAGGGSYELLATTTISSGVSSVSFDGYFSSTYDRYLVTFNNLMFSTDDIHLYIRVRQSNADRTDGSGYRNMAVGSYCEFDGSANANNEEHFGSIDTRGRITVNTIENTDVYGGISGHLEIIDPLQTSYEKVIFTQFCHVRTNDNNGNFQSHGRGVVRYRANTSALSGISFVSDSGNYDGGKIKLYGMK
jgi:hypothetical protein